jgi:rhodanese-related sulfurtransferase
MSKKTKIILFTTICALALIIALIIFFTRETACIRFDPVGEEDMVRNRQISASYARQLMERYPDAVILDVRSPREFATGHIPGAVLLPDYEIAERAAEELPNLYAIILVYCQSGRRSRAATDLLVSMGYENVYDFGGINSWPYEINLDTDPED